MATIIRFFTQILRGNHWPNASPHRTDFLVAQPTALSGAGRLVDIGAVFDSHDPCATPEAVDLRALQADWNVIGQDSCEVLAAQPELE